MKNSKNARLSLFFRQKTKPKKKILRKPQYLRVESSISSEDSSLDINCLLGFRFFKETQSNQNKASFIANTLKRHTSLKRHSNV